MKKVLCVLLAVVMLAAVTGCGGSRDVRYAQGKQGKSVVDVLNEKTNENDPTTETSPDRSQIDAAPTAHPVDAGPVDVDLTTLSSTMVYSEVYNMMAEPEKYMGRRVRMKGSFAIAEGDEKYYFVCLIADATACCAQGIEFVLKDERKFPDEYPSVGAEITVVGIFDTYMEGTLQYYQLIDAVME